MKRCFIVFTVLLSVLVGCSTPKLTIDDIKKSPYIKSTFVNSLSNNSVSMYMKDDFFEKPLPEQFEILNSMRESFNGNKDFAIFHTENEPVIYKFTKDDFQVFSTGQRFKLNKAKKELSSYDKSLVFDFKTKEINTSSSPIMLSNSEKRDVWSYAQTYVKQKLKSPSSANFPVFQDSFISQVGTTVIVNSYVDADNSFGANLRTKFTVTMDRNFNLQDVEIKK